MTTFLTILLAIILSLLTIPSHASLLDTLTPNKVELYQKQFTDFVVKYQKCYDMSKIFQKFETFVENVQWIQRQNNDKTSTFTVSINEFADLSSEEYHQLVVGGLNKKPTSKSTKLHQNQQKQVQTVQSIENVKNVKSSLSDDRFIDWRQLVTLPPVRSRGKCTGGCWATSAADNLGANWAIKHRLSEAPILSAQQYIDCTKPGSLSCHGGSMKWALEWSSENGGLCLERDYPWQEKDGKCNNTCSKPVQNLAFVTLYPSKDDHEHINRLQFATLAVAMNVSSKQVQFYSKGIINHCDDKTPNYGVLNVGYKLDPDTNQYYYIIKNDFGTDWGMEGYMYVAQHVCGLHTSDEDVSAFIQPS